MSIILVKRTVFGIHHNALGEPLPNRKFTFELLRDLAADNIIVPIEKVEVFTSNETGHIGEFEAELYTAQNSFLTYRVTFPNTNTYRFPLPPGGRIPLADVVNLSELPETLPLSLELLSLLSSMIGQEISSLPGGSGYKYVHAQSAASNEWTVNHNLGEKPITSVITTGGAEIEAEILHTSSNQLKVYFSSPVAGYVRCL